MIHALTELASPSFPTAGPDVVIDLEALRIDAGALVADLVVTSGEQSPPARGTAQLVPDVTQHDPGRVHLAVAAWAAALQVLAAGPLDSPPDPSQLGAPGVLQGNASSLGSMIAAMLSHKALGVKIPIDEGPTLSLEDVIAHMGTLESALGGTTSYQFVEWSVEQDLLKVVARLISWEIDGDERSIRSIKEQSVLVLEWLSVASRRRGLAYLTAWHRSLSIALQLAGDEAELTMPCDWAFRKVWELQKAESHTDFGQALLRDSRLLSCV